MPMEPGGLAKMGRGRFVNQKLGKRTSRKSGLAKVRLSAQEPYGKPLRSKGPEPKRMKP